MSTEVPSPTAFSRSTPNLTAGEQPTSQNPPSVLVVDDDRALCHLLKTWLEKEGYEVNVFHDGQTALSGLSHFLPDAICLDLNMPGMSGLHALEQVRAMHPALPVLILTADTNVETIVKAMRIGAYDYLAKPIQRVELINRLSHALDAYRMALKVAQLERDVTGRGFSGIIGNSEPMRALYRQMDRLSTSDITVLILGESGTGKELVARALHQQSHRRTGPFVPVNCAAIPDTLQESELFGHEKGSFTGASTRRVGRFEQAHRGTLFLDEVAELTSAAQAKLLRVVQEQSFVRVGGTKEINSEFRLVAATHRDLSKRVEEGSFRADLYFRIAVFELEVPALRQRRDDIPELVDFFQKEFARRDERVPGTITPAALALMQRYAWPGNVRELQNAVQRGIVASDGAIIEPKHLPPRLVQLSADAPETEIHNRPRDQVQKPTTELQPSIRASDSDQAQSGITTLEEVERKAILDALERLNGNLSRACRELGIGRTTLYRKLRSYGVR